MKLKTLLISTLMLMLVLTACNASPSAPSLGGSQWKLVSYGPADTPIAAAADVETSLVFGTDGTFSGNMGCNSFGGNFEQSGDELTTNQVISTMMACQEPRMSMESFVLPMLSGTLNVKLVGDTLTLSTTDGSKKMELTRSHP